MGVEEFDLFIQEIEGYGKQPKQRVLNEDIAEFFWATCERYKDEKLRKD